MTDTASAQPTSQASATPPVAEPQKALQTASTEKVAPDSGKTDAAEPKKDAGPSHEDLVKMLDAKDEPGEPAEPAEPIKYEWKAPEGVTYEPGLIEVFEAAAQELQLPQDKAQAVLDKVHEAIAKQQVARFEQYEKQWTRSLFEDKDYGDGQPEKFKRANAVANRAFEAFWPKEHAKELEGAMRMFPALRKAFHAVGLKTMPDRLFQGKPVTPEPPKDRAKKFYDTAK